MTAENVVNIKTPDACLKRIGALEHTECFINGDIYMAPLWRYRGMGDTADGTGDLLEGLRPASVNGKLALITTLHSHFAVIASATALYGQALEPCKTETGVYYKLQRGFEEYCERALRQGKEGYGVISPLLIYRAS